MHARAEWANAELRLVLEDVPPELEDAVASLAFDTGVRAFPADAPHAAAAAARFPGCADSLVRQTAGLERAVWDEALALVLARAAGIDWWLAGSAALAARGAAVEPRDLDLISDARGAERLADALSDVLVEPLADGGRLGERWFRAFAGARIECVGGVRPEVDRDEPTDFGPGAAARLDTIEWRGRALRVPPLDLQLRVSERRGLMDRVAAIRKLSA